MHHISPELMNLWFESCGWERPPVDDFLHEGMHGGKAKIKKAIIYWRKMNSHLRRKIGDAKSRLTCMAECRNKCCADLESCREKCWANCMQVLENGELGKCSEVLQVASKSENVCRKMERLLFEHDHNLRALLKQAWKMQRECGGSVVGTSTCTSRRRQQRTCVVHKWQ